MSTISDFEELKCWRYSRKIVNEVYDLSDNSSALKDDCDFNRQLRRAAVSIMNNISEGFGRFSEKEFIRSLEISASSCLEVKSMLYLAKDRNYISESKRFALSELVNKTRAMILSLIKYLRSCL